MTGVVWTVEEDEQLKRLVDEHGTKKWALIATKIKTKGSKQCRRRWKNFLNMNAKNTSWSPEEDEQLIQAHRIHGNRWTAIANIFGDRTDNAVKNRWAALVRKNPELADDEGGGSTGGRDTGLHSAKRQRLGEAPPSSGAFQPYAVMQGQFGPGMLGHFNGQPVTSMPTPFDQQLLLNPPQPQLSSLPRGMPQPHVPQHLLLHQQQQQQQQQQEEGVAPLSIVVNKDILNPWELTLVQQINQAQAPVHIEVQERPPALAAGAGQGPELTAELVTKRSSWRHFVDSLEEPGNQMSDILAWFNNASAAGQLQGASGRRLTRSLSKLAGGGTESLTDEHKSLLVRLMSKGLEYRTNSEQAELDMLGLAAGVLSGDITAEAAAGAVAAAGGGAGEAPGSSHRADPMRRTRSSRRSVEPEGAKPGPGGGPTSFPGFSVKQDGGADATATAPPQAQAQAAPAGGAGGSAGAGGAVLTRRLSSRRQQQLQQQQQQGQQEQGALAGPQPSFGDIFGDVLLTPTFTSQEIAVLIEALTPAAGDRAH